MINKIIIHCSASPQGRGDNAETIHKWHRDRKFDGIGYHYVILEDGEIEQGRPEYWKGAHCRGHNATSIGVCLIGEYEFTAQQYASLHYKIMTIQKRHPHATVYCHSELDPMKTCPGPFVMKWLKDNELR
jgi:N-acetyl-anhydromuramyl-L-alanine amidase AmpD